MVFDELRLCRRLAHLLLRRQVTLPPQANVALPAYVDLNGLAQACFLLLCGIELLTCLNKLQTWH
jgi:hypothetical protein